MENQPGLDALWGSLTVDLSPEGQRILRRLVRAHVRLLAEMLRLVETRGSDGE